ncbi:hypothetical protein EVAR_30398_1 [Eumeta japonica]|uniref:Uncharacterized protein n=1 Tax=Eumeta variegata TaxID=151549 RepID=A0A4C1W6V5_EUMVA|nr:hypothetical protein EVAR_30398_1 [Eumeta japonica]
MGCGYFGRNRSKPTNGNRKGTHKYYQHLHTRYNYRRPWAEPTANHYAMGTSTGRPLPVIHHRHEPTLTGRNAQQ